MLAVKKTWTRERVEKEIAKHLPGWSIREKDWEPKNAKDKAPLRCPRGHAVDRRCDSIVQGKPCKECNRDNERKREYESFVASAIAEGYKPLFSAEEYKNNSTKMMLRCPNGNVYEVAKDRFVSGSRCTCPACRKQNRKSHERLTPEEGRARLLELGEELLEPYRGSNKPVLSRCLSCGYERKIRPDRYLCAGRSCCEKCTRRYKPTTEEYKQKLNEKGWGLSPGEEYKSNRTPIEHVCPNGHRVALRPYDWLRGRGCTKCRYEKLSERIRGKNHPMWDHNKTDEERRELEEARQSPEYHQWRKAVYGRDSYCCVICENNEGVEAHHFYSFTNYRNFRYDKDNGITLCLRHHRRIKGSFHEVYGQYGESTPRQFLEYLEKHVKPGVDGVTEEGIRKAREMALNIIQKVEGAREKAVAF